MSPGGSHQEARWPWRHLWSPPTRKCQHGMDRDHHPNAGMYVSRQEEYGMITPKYPSGMGYGRNGRFPAGPLVDGSSERPG